MISVPVPMHKHDMINSCSESLCINRFDQETDKLLNLWTYLFINLYMYTLLLSLWPMVHMVAPHRQLLHVT